MSENPSPLQTPPANTITETQFRQEPATPRWIKDVFRFLPVKSQFVLSGNVRDRYPYPLGDGKYIPFALAQYLAESLKLREYQYFISFNLVEGFSVVRRAANWMPTAANFSKANSS